MVVAGGAADPAVPFDAFMVPFVKELLTDGMPVAVQIVGPFGSDALVLAFAREVESALAFREHHPLRLAAS